ncbi:MAG TPA: DinB family protein [Vicinamibacteria bacterium]
MTEPARLAELLAQAYFGEVDRSDGIAWHGPSVQRVLSGVTAAGASLRREGGHSIWEITLHVVLWDEICRRRLQGEVIALTTGDPGDWPECPLPTEEAWQATRERLRQAQVALVEAVGKISADDLAGRTPGCTWTHYTMVHGTLHHDLYHAGQIALLVRLLEAGRV